MHVPKAGGFLWKNEEQNKFTDVYYLIKIVNFTVFWNEKDIGNCIYKIKNKRVRKCICHEFSGMVNDRINIFFSTLSQCM